MKSEDRSDSYLGRFWLPSSGESTGVPGVLDIGEDDVVLRLEGGLSPSGRVADVVVFGRLHGTPDTATLINCFSSTWTGITGVLTSKVSATLVGLGTLSESLGGTVIQFRLEGCAAWFQEKNFDYDLGEGSEVIVMFKSFEITRYPVSGSLTVERYYAASIPSGWGEEEFHSERPMRFRIVSEQRLDFDDLWDCMSHLRRFFEFLSQRSMPHAEIALFDNRDLSDGIPDIQIRHTSVHKHKRERGRRVDHLVPFDEIRDRFPSMLVHWFQLKEDRPEPLSRYFAAFDRDSSDPILYFLWNIAALEELHKLRTTRRTGESFNLLGRLKDLRSRWRIAFQPEPSDETLISIRDTRNYYAHAAGDLRTKAAKDWHLLRYGHFLAALSNLEMLALLGLSDDDVIRLADRYWMRDALALRTFPD